MKTDQKIICKSIGQKGMHSSTPGLPDVMRFFSTITSIVQIPETPGRNWSGQEEGQQEIGNVEKWMCLAIPSLVEIPTTKVDKSEVEFSTTRTWNPELHLSTPTTGRNYSNRQEQGLASKETPGTNCRGREEDQQATDKVEQWLRFTNNPPPRTPAPTDEKNAIPNGSKAKDELQKRRTGKINISKSTLPHETTDAFERDRARAGGGMVVRDAAEKKVCFQDRSHSQDSQLLSAPSLELPVRPASTFAASDRLRSKCKYEEGVAAAVRTAQLVAAATRRRHTWPEKDVF